MKCQKLLLLLFLSLVLFAVLPGLLLAETTSEKYERITIELTDLYKEYSIITTNSELTLMDLQEILPQLQKRLNELRNELDLLIKDLDLLAETSQGLLEKWINLKDGIDKLSSSLETLETDFTSLDKSIKKAEFKSNIGVGLSGLSIILLLLYIFFGNK